MGQPEEVENINLAGLAAERWSLLATAIERLAAARSMDAVIDILRTTARRIVGADGITIVLRDGDLCHYVAEDACEPLWAGQRFPAVTCVSGFAMQHNETVAIPDILVDPRVPQEAYRTTFVRSMAMVPIGRPDAVAAVGAYWSDSGQPSGNEIVLLETLTRAAATSLENGRLVASLEELNSALEARVVERTAELEKAQEILRQTQKMEVIGQLTGNVAHDFNNLLSPIMASLDLVLCRGASPEGLLRSAAVGMEAAERAQTLVQRLLAFARRQPLVPSAVDLSDMVGGMRDLMASTVGSRVSLVVDMPADLPRVKADRHQLEMAILNLAVNSRDAMPTGGTITLSVPPQGSQDRPATLPAGDFVCLSVVDEGIGMDEDTLQRAIEPFFSTKSVGHGTGLGLSMVHGLANQLGGALQLFSTPGVGTRVLLWLPVARSVLAKPAANDQVAASAGQETILVIDDEPMVRKGTSEMLAALGYKVVQAETAREGLDLIDAGLKPSVVVTDHIMPGMTGAELALRLRVEHPETAILIISGYQGVDLIAPDVVRLSKPFRQIHLTASIAAAREQVAA